MKKIICLSAIALMMNLTVARAQQSTGSKNDWAAVRSLAKGTRLAANLKDGKKVEGDFTSASDTNLTLAGKNKSITIAQSDVARIYQLIPKSKKKSIGKSALTGAAIGLGAGLGSGAIIGSQEDFATLETVGLLGSIGAGAGAAIGALKGAFSKYRRELIYQSK